MLLLGTYRATDVGLPSRNTPYHDNISSPPITPPLEDGEYCLRHVDQAGDVSSPDGINNRWRDIRGTVDAGHEAPVLNVSQVGQVPR